MGLKAIFWDNDGILVDTEHTFYLATKQVFAQHDITIPLESFIEYSLIKGSTFFDIALSHGLNKDLVDETHQKRNQLYHSMLKESAPVMPGISETLQLLDNKVLCAVVTSAHREHFETIHQSTGLLKYFSFTITNDDCSFTKPNPAPYIMALKKSRFNCDECLVIEDTERGVEAAHGAGIRCFAIPNQLTQSHDFSKADKVFNNITEAQSNIFELIQS